MAAVRRDHGVAVSHYASLYRWSIDQPVQFWNALWDFSGIIATIILLYYADLAGMKGRARKIFGWSVIIFSDLAFAAVTIFSMKRLFVTESGQQSLVNWTMLLADIGLALVLVALAMLMIWRLADLFKKEGRWSQELEETGFDPSPETESASTQEVTP